MAERLPRFILEQARLRWGAAVLVFGLATALRGMLESVAQGGLPMVPYLPTLAIVGLMSGLGPGLLVMVLSTATLAWVWHADAMVLMMYLGAGGVALAVCTYARNTLREAEMLRRRLQLALDQLHTEARRKDTFLATLAHELRSPIAPIRYAVAMLERSRDEAANAHAVSVISRQSALMLRLLDDLMDVSRITRDVVELRRERLDLREIMRLVLDSAFGLLQQAGHTLTTSLPDAPVWVQGDPARLQQVLGNLLDNAVKYTPASGRIDVALTRAFSPEHGEQAVLSVSDTGLGLKHEDTKQVFEVFTQLHRPDVVRDHPAGKGGLGIGLAVVKRLVELHGGQIEVRSPGLDQGSTFTVRLPVAGDAGAQAPRGAAPDAGVAG